MPKRRIFIVLLFMLLLSACAPLTPTNPPQDVNIPPTATMQPEEPTATPAPPTATITPTLAEQVVVLSHESPNIVLTAMHLQIEDNQAQLTQSADQIATLEAESNLLETKVVQAATQAAATAAASSGSSSNSSGGGNTSSGNYNLPKNVYPVVTVDKAYIFVSNRDNKNGVPIMEHYEPRVSLPRGTEAWVYKNPIKADGGTLFYESYDPDGSTPKFKIYFKYNHIQLRPPYADPDPADYPANVARANPINKITVHVAVGQDAQGKPIMDTYKPFIHYKPGQHITLYPEYVVATGGSHWYPIYDPDGKPSAYVRADSVKFLYIWD